MKEIIEKILKKETTINIVILLFVSIIVCLPLLNQNLNIGYDDGVQHIARLMGTYQSIEEGQTFPVIMSKFCNNFGYSWNIFYSPLTAYMPLIFKIFNVSFIACIKCFIFCMVFLSGITMYFFMQEVTKNKKIALIAGILYIFAPYRFTDMYLRNALAELTSFVFIPMIFHGLYGILKEKDKREYLLIIGSCLLVLTHSVIAIYTAIICLIYILTQIKKLKIKMIRNKLLISLIFIVIITSFFLLPLFEHKNATQYEVFKPGRMERTEVLVAFKLNLSELFVTPKDNNMIYEIGWLSIVLLLATPIVIKGTKKRRNTDSFRFYIFSLITGIVCCIMTLKLFPFEKLPATLKMLQFSFRLLEFSSFFFAVVVSINFVTLINTFYKRYKKSKKKVSYRDVEFVIVILTLLSLTFISHLKYSDNINESILWPAVPVTEKTGRVHAGCASFEYLPSKAFENRSYIETREDKVIVISGNPEISNEEKQNTNLKFDISTSEETILELPYIYYLGYSVTLEQDNTKTSLETFETDKGFIGIKISNANNAKVKIEYTGTNLMKVSSIISGLGILLLTFRAVTKKYFKK